MSDPAAQTCPHLAAVEVLARDALADQAHKNEQRATVVRHLEQCEFCRAAYRRLTADAFPRLRSYTVIERIGAGAFGEVFKVIHHAKQRTEALKLLYTETRFRTESFENEVHLIAGLRHPGIATLYDAHLGSPPFYYTMEFVEGRQLDDHFRWHDVPLADRIEIIRQTALAVDYAHRQGVVHRDLKPQNILIDTAGRPRIVDFGIARKLAQGAEHADTAVGPPAQPEGSYGYIAPEEEAGAAIDGRADIYALGVSLCRSVTGELPPADERLRNLTNALRESQVSRARDLAAIIVRCLQTDPVRRYSTCAELSDDLGRYLAGGPVRARDRAAFGYRAARLTTAAFRKHPRLIGWAVLLAVTISLTGMFLIARTRWLATGASNPGAVLISFTPSTIDAIRDGQIGGDLAGLAVQNRKTWRMLHGRLMEKLAEASPRAVVWDYHFPDCQPEYDPLFLRGFEALSLIGVPVVVGCKNLDLNGAPLGCEHILSAAHAVGTLQGADLATDPGQFLVPICIKHGLAPLVPGLAAAGFAAVRFPDSTLDLRSERDRVLAHYRRKQFAANQPAWRTEIDEFPLAARKKMNDRFLGLMKSQGELLLTRVRATEPEQWSSRTVPFEAVLLASRDELRTWFKGRAVIVGQMLPGEDQHQTGLGTEIYGCLVQAQAMDAFLTQAHQPALTDWGVIIRTMLYCLLGGFIGRTVPLMPPHRDRLAMFACLGVGLLATCALAAAGSVHSRWPTEISIAASAVLAAGCAIYLCRVLHYRQSRIGGGPEWPSPESAASTSVVSNAE